MPLSFSLQAHTEPCLFAPWSSCPGLPGSAEEPEVVNLMEACKAGVHGDEERFVQNVSQ